MLPAAQYCKGNADALHGKVEDEESTDKAAATAPRASVVVAGKKKCGLWDKEAVYYDAIKHDLAAQTAETRALLQQLDLQTRQAMEGFRPGAYVRIKLTGRL